MALYACPAQVLHNYNSVFQVVNHLVYESGIVWSSLCTIRLGLVLISLAETVTYIVINVAVLTLSLE